MSGQHRFRLAIAGALLTNVSFTGLAVASDAYYFRVKAPLLGVIKDLKLGVFGDTSGMVGQPVRAQVMVLKGQGPFGYAVSSGSLPPGVAINSQTGEIAGSPQKAGDFSADIAVSGSMDSKGDITYSSHINAELEVSGTPDDKIISGDQYHATFVATGGDGNYSWSLDGVLPPGLSFSNGSISGISTVLGTFDGLVVTAQDGTGAKKSSASFSITVTDGLKTVSASQANLVLSSLFSPSEWQSSRPKRVVIPSGVVVYSDSIASPAVSSGAGWNGSLTLQINSGGEVQGAGGRGGIGAKGSDGGDAIAVQANGLNVVNNGAIRAGGGGGGSGGKGADGEVRLGAREPASGYKLSNESWNWYGCEWHFNSGNSNETIMWAGKDVNTVPTQSELQYMDYGGYRYYCVTDGVYIDRYPDKLKPVYRVALSTAPTPTTGGLGGSGGDGRGHDRTNSAGTIGLAGGENAGVGGQGGSGGTWGTSGLAGIQGAASNIASGSAGQSGGLAGYAIKGNVSYSGSGVKQGR